MSQNLERKKNVIRRWVEEVFNAKNLSAANELKTTNYVDWTPLPGQAPALAGFKGSLRHVMGAFPNFRYTIGDIIAEGDFVAVRGSWRATHEGEWFGVAPSGREISGERIDVFRVVHNKMEEHWGSGNEWDLMELLEVVPRT